MQNTVVWSTQEPTVVPYMLRLKAQAGQIGKTLKEAGMEQQREPRKLTAPCRASGRHNVSKRP